VRWQKVLPKRSNVVEEKIRCQEKLKDDGLDNRLPGHFSR
jgi:hypothetical protein